MDGRSQLLTRNEFPAIYDIIGEDMKEIPLNRVEFYERGGPLLDALRSAAVPRKGEYVNIAKQQWKVAYVSWAIDEDRPWGKELRANVELLRVADNEVGPE